MRDKWYSDNRDLIKWSVLLLLARRAGVDRIIQIALLNPSDFGQIEIDGEPHQIPSEVLSHFRDLRNITGLLGTRRSLSSIALSETETVIFALH